jgi:Restriction endonuclease
MSGTIAQSALEFEQLVSDLLIALNFENVTLVGNEDWGADIQASYVIKSPTGEKVSQLWLVEIKYYVESKVDVRTIAQLSAILNVKRGAKALLVTSSNLTSSAWDYVQKFNASVERRLEVWDRDKLLSLLARFPQLEAKYKQITSGFPLSLSTAKNEVSSSLIQRLLSCPPGKEGWKDFEDICTQILTEVFVPPLKPPKPQARTLNGLERRDALFSLRDADTDGSIPVM